jgi:hypothetical protein
MAAKGVTGTILPSTIIRGEAATKEISIYPATD